MLDKLIMFLFILTNALWVLNMFITKDKMLMYLIIIILNTIMYMFYLKFIRPKI